MSRFHPLNLTRTVLDPVQGTVRLTAEEFAVLDHPIFRRLHRIRQNGMLYLVFPSATHSRFEHCVGVVQTADLMLQNLLYNSGAAQREGRAVAGIAEAALGEAVDFTQVTPQVLAQIFRITRLTALVHDLGHGPFSHAFDRFAPSADHIAELVRNDHRLASIRELAERLERKGSRPRVQHEDMSCVLFCLIWADVRPDKRISHARTTHVPSAVAAVLRNLPELCDDEALRPYVGLMHDLIASAPMDADRMDYMERDSRAIGVSYGRYDRNRLLTSILVYKAADRSYRLGFKRSGLHAVENFIQARFQLFVQVYYHKTNRAIEQMLSVIGEMADDLNLFAGVDVDGLVRIYRELSDEQFLAALRGIGNVLEVKSPEIHQLANCIYDRRLWKRVFEGTPDDARKIVEHLATFTDAGLLRAFDVDPQATKGLDRGAALLERVGAARVYKAGGRKSWIQASPIIRVLANAEQKIGRVYLLNDDAKLGRSLRATARAYAAENKLKSDA